MLGKVFIFTGFHNAFVTFRFTCFSKVVTFIIRFIFIKELCCLCNYRLGPLGCGLMRGIILQSGRLGILQDVILAFLNTSFDCPSKCIICTHCGRMGSELLVDAMVEPLVISKFHIRLIQFNYLLIQISFYHFFQSDLQFFKLNQRHNFPFLLIFSFYFQFLISQILNSTFSIYVYVLLIILQPSFKVQLQTKMLQIFFGKIKLNNWKLQTKIILTNSSYSQMTQINTKLLQKLSYLLKNQQIEKLKQKLTKQLKETKKVSCINRIKAQKPQNSDSNIAKKTNIQSNIQNLAGSETKPKRQQKWQKPLLDKAIFFQTTQLPYLQSSDLLSHLYKNTTIDQQQQQTTCQPLFNNPSEPRILMKIKSLYLYYCKIQSLRDMGTGWSNIKNLTVYYGQLKDLSGLPAFTSIQYLNLPFNQIQSISQVMFHPTLRSIDLQSNSLSNQQQIQHLYTIELLQYINLINNPIYNSKQTQRKINLKFDKIIDQPNNKLEQYCYQKQREIWQIQNQTNLQVSNNLIKEFYLLTKNDQITIQNKFIYTLKQQDQCQHQQYNKDRQIVCQYIPSQIPPNQQIQDQILNGNIDSQNFCQQKIFLTPLIQFVNPNQKFSCTVLNKYLMGKFYAREQIQTSKISNKKMECQNKDNEKVQKAQTTKLKRLNRLALTSFPSQHSNQQKQFQATCSTLTTQSTTLQQKPRPFKRSKLSLTKSTQKSSNKIILKIAQNVNELSQTINGSNMVGSLAKHNRLFVGRSLKKMNSHNNQDNNKFTGQLRQPNSIDKNSFSSVLKRIPFKNHKRSPNALDSQIIPIDTIN